jgi:hypothetical protein
MVSKHRRCISLRLQTSLDGEKSLLSRLLGGHGCHRASATMLGPYHVGGPTTLSPRFAPQNVATPFTNTLVPLAWIARDLRIVPTIIRHFVTLCEVLGLKRAAGSRRLTGGLLSIR